MITLKIISCELSGDFAAFSDPSITTNQSVYFIPSKSAIIGLIGGLIGVRRDITKIAFEEKWYNDEFLDLLLNIRIGLSFESEPAKFTYFSNNVSLKENKKKPFKREVLEKPKYKLYISTEKYWDRVKDVLCTKGFEFSPYLGNAFCPARIENVETFDAEKTEPKGKTTSSVILDESETYNPNFQVEVQPVRDGSRIIVERHLHHIVGEKVDQETSEVVLQLERFALKHWIPIGDSEYRISKYFGGSLSEFIEIDGKVVCLY